MKYNCISENKVKSHGEIDNESNCFEREKFAYVRQEWWTFSNTSPVNNIINGRPNSEKFSKYKEFHKTERSGIKV